MTTSDNNRRRRSSKRWIGQKKKRKAPKTISLSFFPSNFRSIDIVDVFFSFSLYFFPRLRNEAPVFLCAIGKGFSTHAFFKESGNTASAAAGRTFGQLPAGAPAAASGDAAADEDIRGVVRSGDGVLLRQPQTGKTHAEGGLPEPRHGDLPAVLLHRRRTAAASRRTRHAEIVAASAAGGIARAVDAQRGGWRLRRRRCGGGRRTVIISRGIHFLYPEDFFGLRPINRLLFLLLAK